MPQRAITRTANHSPNHQISVTMIHHERGCVPASGTPAILSPYHGIALHCSDAVFAHKLAIGNNSAPAVCIPSARIGASIPVRPLIARNLRTRAAVTVADNRDRPLMRTLEFRHILIISWTPLDTFDPRSARLPRLPRRYGCATGPTAHNTRLIPRPFEAVYGLSALAHGAHFAPSDAHDAPGRPHMLPTAHRNAPAQP